MNRLLSFLNRLQENKAAVSAQRKCVVDIDARSRLLWVPEHGPYDLVFVQVAVAHEDGSRLYIFQMGNGDYVTALFREGEAGENLAPMYLASERPATPVPLQPVPQDVLGLRQPDQLFVLVRRQKHLSASYLTPDQIQ